MKKQRLQNSKGLKIDFNQILPPETLDRTRSTEKMVIASILMSLGMMMLSPMLISLPFKLLLFVLVDGWAMTIGSLSAPLLVS